MKKPKKKKAKSTRQKVVDEDDIFPEVAAADTPQEEGNSMDVDQPAVATKKRTFNDMSFVDDEDLQASLAAQRRNALKKRQKLRFACFPFIILTSISGRLGTMNCQPLHVSFNLRYFKAGVLRMSHQLCYFQAIPFSLC
jgi:hypothetical protein